MTNESIPRTLLVAAMVALFCSVIVSAAVHFLRPLQASYESLERYRAILTAAELMPDDGLSDDELVERYLDLDARVVDLESGWFTDDIDAHAYDHWLADEGGRQLDDRARYLPVYLLRDGRRPERLILPVDGGGMWSTIYGYLALDGDLNTIADIVIYRHGETPGIGDKIEEPAWLAAWRGKTLRDDQGDLRFQVKKNADGPHEVDAISGATITSQAAGNLVRDWLGENGYESFLDNLTERGL